MKEDKPLKEGMRREIEREERSGFGGVVYQTERRSQRRTKKQKRRTHHLVVGVGVVREKRNKIKAILLFLEVC